MKRLPPFAIPILLKKFFLLRKLYQIIDLHPYSFQNVAELRRIWRTRQAMDSCKGWMLSAAGYPLNPHGRRGM